MTALWYFRIGLDTHEIARRLGVTEQRATAMLLQDRENERSDMQRKRWAATNGAKIDALKAEGLLP